MKLLLEDIYGKLSAIIPNTYFSQLPENIDSAQNFCVYEANISESKNTLSEIDFENGVDVTVKILSKDIAFLFSSADLITSSILQSTANYYSAIVNNTVPVFYDANLELSQYTIVFNVNKKGSNHKIHQV
jgi:hypothetical protein